MLQSASPSPGRPTLVSATSRSPQWVPMRKGVGGVRFSSRSLLPERAGLCGDGRLAWANANGTALFETTCTDSCDRVACPSARCCSHTLVRSKLRACFFFAFCSLRRERCSARGMPPSVSAWPPALPWPRNTRGSGHAITNCVHCIGSTRVLSRHPHQRSFALPLLFHRQFVCFDLAASLASHSHSRRSRRRGHLCP
jgi:hypothetical protein